MLFRYFKLSCSILILLFISACGNQITKQEKQVEEPLIVNQKSDTLLVRGKTIFLSSITKEEFDTKYIAPGIDTNEQKNISLDKEHVKRVGDVLHLTLNNGKKLSFKNVITEDEYYVAYNYLANYRDINQWLLRVDYFEARSFWLIDYVKGDTTYIYGIPYFSPNKKQFICGSVDLHAAFLSNGLELYTLKSGIISKSWQRDLNDWSAEKFVWINDSIVYAEQIKRDSLSSEGQVSNYIKMSLKTLD